MADIQTMSIDPTPVNGGQGKQDDDSMDTDSEGGVQIITSSCEDNSPDTMKVKSVYHQASVNELDSSSYAWKLPASPGAYHAKWSKYSQEHPIVKTYQKHCGLILRHWKCQPDNFLPLEVQSQTPYSLAMLSSLRRLASATKGNFEFAQSQILEAWRNRMAQGDILGRQNVSLIETTITTNPKARIPNHNESKIVQNLAGLILEDVDEAFQAVSRARTEQRKANKAAGQSRTGRRNANRAENEGSTRAARRRSNKLKKAELQTPQHIHRQQWILDPNVSLNEILPSSIAERVINRRRQERGSRKAAAQATRFEDELVDVEIGSFVGRQTGFQSAFGAPPNGPISMYDRRNTFAPNVALREVGGRHNEQADTVEHDDEVIYKPSKRDRHQDHLMSSSLNNIDIDALAHIKRKRLKNLQAGGHSRIGHPKVEMPSERIRLDSLPSLQPIHPPTSASDLADLGQHPLPDQMSFAIPVRTRRSG